MTAHKTENDTRRRAKAWPVQSQNKRGKTKSAKTPNPNTGKENSTVIVREAFRLTAEGKSEIYSSIAERSFAIADAMIASLEAESVKDPEKGLLVLTSVSSALEKIARSYQRINKPVNRLAVAMEVIQLIGDAVSKAPKHKTGRENFEGILTEIGAECVRRYSGDK